MHLLVILLLSRSLNVYGLIAPVNKQFLLYVPVIRKFLSWTYENNSHTLGCHNKIEDKLYLYVLPCQLHCYATAAFSSLLFQLYNVCMCLHVTLNLHVYNII